MRILERHLRLSLEGIAYAWRDNSPKRHGPQDAEMETLEGFPCLPATVRDERSSAAPHATDMETLEGFSMPSRDGSRRAKLGGSPRD
jgi:hypothetical protein